MYSRYRSNFYPSYTFGYPNYGYYGSPYYGGFGYNYSSRYNYDDYSSDDWNTYYYGRSRRNPYSWERDRSISNRYATPDTSTSRVTPDNSTSRMTPDNNTGRVTPDNNTGRVTPDNNTGRVTPDNNTGRVTPDNNTGRVTPDNNTGRVTPDNSNNRATPDNSTSRATPDNSNGRAIPDNSNSRATPDNSNSRVTHDTIYSRATRERPRRVVTPPPIETPADEPPIPVEPIMPTYELPTDLIVKDVDLHLDENTTNHRTDDYHCVEVDKDEDDNDIPGELVVRRGQTMKLTITFDRPYQEKKNDFQVGFSIGKNPSHSQGSQVQFEVDESGSAKFEPDAWGANLDSKSGNNVTISVHIPANCIVGEWNMYLKTFSEGNDENGRKKIAIWEYKHNQDVTILFNPWCEGDGVFMREKDLLKEYVLNPSGCVFRGTPDRIGAKEWHYGQFDEDILDICLTVVRQGFRYGKSTSMSDPVKVSRVIAQMVNASQDNGVLVGNWSGDYDDGERPNKWAGSVKILRKWKKDGPVRYGQCWVFACLTTTVCRALGIPCRTVTNFSSAHDVDESCTIDYYQDESGERIQNDNSDSVWNFHCWNEVWLNRHDLGDKRMNGWQVIDATPQEASNGIYTLGPCPLSAVKRGLCATNYDSAFVFCEVNGDKVTWTIDASGETTVKTIDKDSVGEKISTKVADGEPYKIVSNTPHWLYTESRRMDITGEYKFIEGTPEERRAVLKAHTTTRKPWPGVYEHHEENMIEKVEVSLSIDDDVMVGQDLKMKLTAKNGGKHNRTLSKIKLTVTSKTYSGTLGKRLLEKSFPAETVNKGDETSFEAMLRVDEYLKHIDPQGIVSVVANVVVESVLGGKNQFIEQEKDIRFRRPDLDVKCPLKANKGDKVTFEVSFKNPLDETLINCDISMESDGFDNLEDVRVKDIPPNSIFNEKFELVAKKLKRHTAVFSFDSKQLTDVTGSDSITIVR